MRCDYFKGHLTQGFKFFTFHDGRNKMLQTLLVIAVFVAACSAATLSNTKLSATITTDGLLSVGNLKVSNDAWSVATTSKLI